MSKQMVKSGFGGGALNNGVAGFAALAMGFLVFAMPDEILARLVAASGLAGIVPAAQPPFGLTAHLGVIGAATIFSFLAVWLLLRALDRLPAKRPSAFTVDPAFEMPRARRADAHPDAPLRRPILAGRELGEPIQDFPFGDELPDVSDFTSSPAPLPGFLDAQAEEPRPETESLEQDVADVEPDPKPDILELNQEDAGTIDALSARLPLPAAVEEDKISSLMERLETGLSRRAPLSSEAEIAFEAGDRDDSVEPDAPAAEQAGDEQVVEEPILASAPEPPSEPEEPAPAPAPHIGHRLRSAIQDLEKIAASGG